MLADGVHTLANGHARITADVLILDEPVGPVDVVLSAQQAGHSTIRRHRSVDVYAAQHRPRNSHRTATDSWADLLL